MLQPELTIQQPLVQHPRVEEPTIPTLVSREEKPVVPNSPLIEAQDWLVVALPPIFAMSPSTAPPNDPTVFHIVSTMSCAGNAIRQQHCRMVASWCHKQAQAIFDHKTGELLEYHQLFKHLKFKETRNLLAVNEFGWLAQRIKGRVTPTYTIRFIHKHKVPQDSIIDIAYITFVCAFQTKKKELNCTWATMQENPIDYPVNMDIPTADLLLIKVIPTLSFQCWVHDSLMQTPTSTSWPSWNAPSMQKNHYTDIPDESI